MEWEWPWSILYIWTRRCHQIFAKAWYGSYMPCSPSGWRRLWIFCKETTGDFIFGSKLLRWIRQCWRNDERRWILALLLSGEFKSKGKGRCLDDHQHIHQLCTLSELDLETGRKEIKECIQRRCRTRQRQKACEQGHVKENECIVYPHLPFHVIRNLRVVNSRAFIETRPMEILFFLCILNIGHLLHDRSTPCLIDAG